MLMEAQAGRRNKRAIVSLLHLGEYGRRRWEGSMEGGGGREGSAFTFDF